MDPRTSAGLAWPRLWIFDLGDTLFEYAGLPLSWERHYPDALRSLARHWRSEPDSDALERATSVLRRFNTRLYPRAHEVDFGEIAAELASAFGSRGGSGDLAAARAFFGGFRQRLAAFPEAVSSLACLRRLGCRIAALTDVPYGMPRELVEEDLREAGLAEQIDRLFTSVDVRSRKPSPEGLRRVLVAERVAEMEAVYVGNERKDIDAAKAAGMRAVLVDRAGLAPEWGQDARCVSLSDLPGLWRDAGGP